MKFIEKKIGGVWMIDPERYKDNRGYFMRAWCRNEFADHKIDFVPVQANMGFSEHKGTIRGMHFQEAPAHEAKLVRCTIGAIFDVVVDLRPGSATYGKWQSEELTAKNGRMLYIPENCAHGFQTLEECTEIYYMASEFYSPNFATGIRFDDPSISIKWPLSPTMVSEQDRNWPLLNL